MGRLWLEEVPRAAGCGWLRACGFEVVTRSGCARKLDWVRGGAFRLGGGGVRGIAGGGTCLSESVEARRDGVWSGCGEDAMEVVEAVGLEFFVFDFGCLRFG